MNNKYKELEAWARSRIAQLLQGRITERCKECGSVDLYIGYDAMLSLDAYNNNELEHAGYLDGDVNDYIYCPHCGDEVDTVEDDNND